MGAQPVGCVRNRAQVPAIIAGVLWGADCTHKHAKCWQSLLVTWDSVDTLVKLMSGWCSSRHCHTKQKN